MPPLQERPPTPVPESHVPRSGIRYPVKSGETWVSIARDYRIDIWDLIDFNFPGTKATSLHNFQLATRHVNWYLSEYVGCTVSLDGKNWAFTSGLTGGKGVWKGGVIYIPPPTLDNLPCEIISIPPLALPVAVRTVLSSLGVRLPTRARCLHPAELKDAKEVYADSLVYDDIYVADSVGASGRPVTTAVSINGRWIVALNLGPHAFDKPSADKSTLIHELAHAWQSQHHPEPWQYMVNCAKSQAMAEAATAAAFANSNKYARAVQCAVSVCLPDYDLGEASAYAYVPGRAFGDYGGEQIAMQVEDSLMPFGLSDSAKGHINWIREQVKSFPARMPHPENIRGLNTVKYEHRNTPNVVWHK